MSLEFSSAMPANGPVAQRGSWAPYFDAPEPLEEFAKTAT